MTVRELGPGDAGLAYDAALELRPGLGSRDDFVRRIDELQRPEGFRVVAAFAGDPGRAAAYAGFRTGHNTAWGHYLYIDDLATLPEHRRQGHAGTLLRWVIDEARRLGCDEVHLDSGHQRFDAHRVYLAGGLDITAHHFRARLDPAG
jgi:GNAT superfamily N-acetyltransferase